MSLSLTPEQSALCAQIQSRKAATAKREALVTQILQLKASGMTHADIAQCVGKSTSLINLISRNALAVFKESVGGEHQ